MAARCNGRSSGGNIFPASPPKVLVTLPNRCVAEGNDSPDSMDSKESLLTGFLSGSASLNVLSAKCQLHVFPGKHVSKRRWVVSYRTDEDLALLFVGGL